MLPSFATDNLALAIEIAETLAAEGKWASGYQTLLLSREDAEEGFPPCAPWAPEMLACWEQAIAAYVDRYGVPLH
jgi:hypothetical protein